MCKLVLIAVVTTALVVNAASSVAAKDPPSEANRSLNRAAQVTGVHTPVERFPDESAVQPSRESA